MKLFFVKEDSIYKIFKTLEKIPRWKSLEIFIDAEHSIFENDRRTKQLKEIIKKKAFDVTFNTKDKRCREYFQENWLKTNHQQKSNFRKTLSVLYLFFFNIKKFYLHSYNRKNYIFYVITVFEVIFILIILYLLYILVLPSVTLRIQPSKDVNSIIYNFRYYPEELTNYNSDNSRYINVPYSSGYLDYKYELSIDTQNIEYMNNPSQGNVKIINNTKQRYEFVPNTRFITDEGLLFQTNDWLAIPAAMWDIPWETNVELYAMEKDDFGNFMWTNSNISKNTQLYVKNIKQSYFLKKLYAVAMEDFTGWESESKWSIQSWDIQILKDKLRDYVESNQVQIAKENFNVKDSILISIDNTISYEVVYEEIDSQVWDQSNKVRWHIIARIHFYYIKRDDLIKAFEEYIVQRPMQQNSVISIDKDSIYFFDEYENKYLENNVFIIPTKINVIEWYDFEKDANWVTSQIKQDILWKTENEALQEILSYDEISAVEIKVSPFWSNTITNVKSRINIENME